MNTWLCVNADGTYVVFNLREGEFLEYIRGNWEKVTYDKLGVTVTHPYAGVKISESHFATNLQGLESGERILLK